MTDTAHARRYRLLERLSERPDGLTLGELAEELGADERTIRRDADQIRDLLTHVPGIQLVRGRLKPGGSGAVASPTERSTVKERMAEACLRRIEDGSAIVLTAGSTTLAVASAIRRAEMLDMPPRDLIVFTNSLPALLDLVAAGVSTGVLGEVYNPRDLAFHSQELRTRFQASLAVVGASGIVPDVAAGYVSLCSDRVEEAAFMRQVLAPIPEIVVVADASKIGRRHPWSFTSEGLLVGKSVHLITTPLERAQSEALAGAAEAGRRLGVSLSFEEVHPCAE
ncbi:MAG: DeoR/GlpR transcriptional regulator [Chthonomonadales bacterium]|nr:DeoR/GlpR transcriptional regulator [Chthonomonadales bacterium]